MSVEPICKVYVLIRYNLPLEAYTDGDQANAKAERINSTLKIKTGSDAYCYVHKVNLYS